MSQPPPVEDIPRCPVCLSPCRVDQRYCLECGARLAAGEPAKRRLPLGPEPPKRSHVVALAIVGLAALGVFFAWALTSGDDEHGGAAGSATTHQTTGTTGRPASSGTTGGSATSLPVVTPTDSGAGSETFPPPESTFSTVEPTSSDSSTEAPPPTTTQEQPPTTTDEQPAEPTVITDQWTADGDWAVILASKDADTTKVSTMSDMRRTARNRGLSPVGVLISDNWASLNPGYWVLYQGPFPTRDSATQAAGVAQTKGYPGAYPRQVSSS